MLNQQKQEDLLLLWSHDAVCFIAVWTPLSPPQEAAPAPHPSFFFSGLVIETTLRPDAMEVSDSEDIELQDRKLDPSEGLCKWQQFHCQSSSSQVSWQDVDANHRLQDTTKYFKSSTTGTINGPVWPARWESCDCQRQVVSRLVLAVLACYLL